MDPHAQVMGWLDDVGISYREGGVKGPAVAWSVSMQFGGTTHVSLAYDTRYPKRLEVMSDLTIADDHRAAYAGLRSPEREAFDRALLRILLQRANVSFGIARGAKGAPETVSMRVFLPLEGLAPGALVAAIHDARNTTMELCVACQEALGEGAGGALDRALTDPGYANVVLQKGTLDTLDAFQIPGETLDETILRAVRE